MNLTRQFLLALFLFLACLFYSKGQITERTVDTSYNNDASYIDSEEQASKMKSDNARDVKPPEHCYASIHDPPVSSTSSSTVALSFPHASAENSSQGSAASINQPLHGAAAAPVYQPINSGDAEHIYQPLNSDTTIPEVRADKNTEEAMPSPPTKQSE